MPNSETKQIKEEFQILAENDKQLIFGGYAEAFFHEWLGARETIALEASDYEGASRIHDLNLPVPEAWNESFDLVIDAGTLEHVFNFPIAVESCLRMVKTGGTIFWSMPANNYCGHGFYQFSPELIYRIFSRESGVQVKQLLLFTHPFPGAELSSRMKFYFMRDPDELRSRAAFINGAPTGLLVEAQKWRKLPLFGTFPQQSDYARVWGGATLTRVIFADAEASFWKPFANRAGIWLDQHLPTSLRNWLAGQYQRHIIFSLNNRRIFRRKRTQI